MDEMVLERAKRISLLLMDCDGVLTDGWIILLPDGQEVKAFNSQDGHGLKMAQRAGLRTGVITGRGSVALDQRAKEVGIEFVFQNAKDKNAVMNELLHSQGIEPDQVAFIGDDLPDLPPMQRVGLAVAVSNAVAELKAIAHYTTEKHGGHGAVREVIELILKAQGKLEGNVFHFFA